MQRFCISLFSVYIRLVNLPLVASLATWWRLIQLRIVLIAHTCLDVVKEERSRERVLILTHSNLAARSAPRRTLATVSTHALTVNMSGRGKGGKEQGKDI